MFTIQTYLYKQIQVVIIGTGPYDRKYEMVYQRNVKLQRGVDNALRFQFKNQDQKPVNIAAYTIKMHIMDQIEERALLTKTCSIENGLKGIAYTLIDSEELIDLPQGFYTYSIEIWDGENNNSAAFSDDNFNAGGTLEIAGKVFPTFIDTIVPPIGDYVLDVAYTSSTLTESGLHTAAYYLDDFVGDITMQATMDGIPDLNAANYFDVSTDSYDVNDIGPVYVNATGRFHAIRFKIAKTSGDVTQILYRP